VSNEDDKNPLPDKAETEGLVPFWDHVYELTRRLKAWLYSFLIATVLFLVLPGDDAFLKMPFQVYHPLITVILLGIRNRLLTSQYILIGGTVTAPYEVIGVGAAVFGFVASIPVLAYEVYKFVDPAIRPNERQSIYPFVTGFSILFVTGAAFAFFVLIPFVFYFSIYFFGAIGTSPFLNVTDFYYLVFFIMAGSGLAFTMPVILVLLVKMHIIGTAGFRKNRKYVWGITFILTAAASPDGGPIADIALFVPMIILIEGALWFARRYEKNDTLIVKAETDSDLTPAKCSYCGGPFDQGGVFCGLCGKARV
jgi:sec-independent protein translocase protein TatC